MLHTVFDFSFNSAKLVDWNIQPNVALLRKLEPIPLSQKYVILFFYEICTIGYNANVPARKWWIKNASPDLVFVNIITFEHYNFFLFC